MIISLLIFLIINFCEHAQYSIESAICQKEKFCCESCTLAESAPVSIVSRPSPKKNRQISNIWSTEPD